MTTPKFLCVLVLGVAMWAVLWLGVIEIGKLLIDEWFGTPQEYSTK